MYLQRSAVLFAMLLLSTILDPRVACAAISFLPPIHTAVPGAAEVRAADMDGDGKLDLVAVGTEGVSILYGEGDGTLGARLDYALGGGLGLHNHIQIALTDLNGDGARDLIIPVLNLNKLLVFMNRGQRSFAPAVNVPVGGNPESLVAGDFNRDGKQDLAVSNLAGGSMAVLLNRGDGTLQPPVSYSGVGNAGGLTSADFNGDGHLDLAMSSFYGNHGTLYLGDGSGIFAGSRYEVGGATPGRVVADDFNGDGKVDLATANYHGENVSILLGDGRGTFSRPINYAAPMYPFVIAAADLDGDGDPDLVMINSTLDYFTVLENGEVGNFLPAVKFSSGGKFVQGLTAADFNRDGLPDVAIANAGSDAVSVFLNNSPRPTPAILAFDVDPSDLVGGCQTAGGTVTLTRPAPAGGIVVSLTSTNPAVALPPSLTIPVGAVSASFTPTVSAVTTAQPGTLTASIPGSAKRVVMTVRPGGMAGLQLTPNDLTGGSPTTGRVTFACPAGSEGLVITLTSSRPQVAQPPAAVAAASRATGASFNLATRPVTTVTPVVITATFAGLTRTATLLVRPVPAPPPPPPALAAPTGLQAQVVFADQINLTWTDNSRDETGFALFRREGAGPWARIALVGPNVTRFADLDVRQGVTYTYRVQAVSDTGASGWSNEAVIHLGPKPPPALSPPSALSATVLSLTEFRLIWRDNSSDEHAFAVWRRTTTSDWTRIAVLPPNTTRFIDQSVAPGSTYTYRVRATRGSVASGWSNEVSVTTVSIDGIPYVASPVRETLTATFTRPDGGVTVDAYQGYVLLHVTGVGQAYGSAFNDAFYLFTGPFNPSRNGHDGGYYQLTFGTSPLQAFSLASNARNFLVGPLPAYNPAHEYTIILNTRLSSPAPLHFGISDGGYNDNTGAYTVTVMQLVPLR